MRAPRAEKRFEGYRKNTPSSRATRCWNISGRMRETGQTPYGSEKPVPGSVQPVTLPNMPPDVRIAGRGCAVVDCAPRRYEDPRPCCPRRSRADTKSMLPTLISPMPSPVMRGRRSGAAAATANRRPDCRDVARTARGRGCGGKAGPGGAPRSATVEPCDPSRKFRPQVPKMPLSHQRPSPSPGRAFQRCRKICRKAPSSARAAASGAIPRATCTAKMANRPVRRKR